MLRNIRSGFCIQSVLVASLLVFCEGAISQELLAKGEELVELEAIPLSRAMSFEQGHPDEFVELIGLSALRALDASTSWNPRSPGWDLYRVNMVVDMDEKLRARWQSVSGRIRTLSQSPDTALAQFFSDQMSAAELGQALEFYKSPAGKKFIAYQAQLRRTFYKGRYEFEKYVASQQVAGAPAKSALELKKEWLLAQKLQPEPPNDAYVFHARTLQRIFPQVPATELVFSLAVGAVPNTPAMERLNALLPDDAREAVIKYLDSPTAQKELAAIKSWQEALTKNFELAPFFVGDLRSILDVIVAWQKTRSMPNALPKSMAKVDPTSIRIPDAFNLVTLEVDGSKALRDCLPSISDTTKESFDKFIQAKSYNSNSITYVNKDDNAFFMTRGASGTCVTTTKSGYPIVPLDAYVSTIRVNGMEEGQAREWRRKISLDLATSGASDSLVVSGSGNAYEVEYAVDASAVQRLVYRYKWMAKGSYRVEDYKIVENVPTLRSVSKTMVTVNGVSKPQKLLITMPAELKREQESKD